ncbi:MAG: PLDc N-terminal domain-containing protein [Chloroflexi bacterium]|nr:PLDc N-terminal domain-containing protein [Chloroflexota bacterium]
MFSGLNDAMPYLLPVLIVHATAAALVIVNIFQRKKVAGGHKLPWIIAAVIIVILGPAIYYFVGRVAEDMHNAKN